MSTQPNVPQAPPAPSIQTNGDANLSLEQAAVLGGMRVGSYEYGERLVEAKHGSLATYQREWRKAHESGAASVTPVSQAAPGTNSVIKDNAGRIVVTGPNGKTVVIDPRTGLDGDQIQEVVQTALQPQQFVTRDPNQIPKEVIPIIAIVLTFLFAIAWVIARAISGRRITAGSVTATLPPDATARLARIEQAVEAVAIEVERISEAQRYSAQLLTDRFTPPNTAAIARTVDGSAGRG